MAESKKSANNKKGSTQKKTSTKAKTNVKTSGKKNTNKKEVKKTNDVKAVEIEEIKVSKPKKEKKFKKWLDNISLEQIMITGFIIIAILLIVLICVSAKNTKTSNGKDVVAKLSGKTITADELYKELKGKDGRAVLVNLVDDYVAIKEELYAKKRQAIGYANFILAFTMLDK